MTDFFTDTRSSMDACSLLDEEIAAFLDGTLSPEDRERITAHLTSCESCYEVFAATIQFQEDEAKEGIPFPFVEDQDREGVSPPLIAGAVLSPFAEETDRTGVSRPPIVAPEKVRPRTSRWLALAASLLLIPALGYFAWRELVAPPRIILADVAEPLKTDVGASDLLYDDLDFRGDDSATGPYFMAGVYLLDLRLSLQAKDVAHTEELLQDLSQALQEIPHLPEQLEALARTYQEQSTHLKTSSDLARFAPQHPASEERIQKELSGFDEFQFGLWAEAGRLSALTESPEFFDRRKNSRFLSRLLKEETLPVPTDLHETVLEDLQAVRNAWDLSPRNYALIAKHLETIIRVIDQYEEEDFSSEN